mgnify:CR=1 FL=1
MRKSELQRRQEFEMRRQDEMMYRNNGNQDGGSMNRRGGNRGGGGNDNMNQNNMMSQFDPSMLNQVCFCISHFLQTLVAEHILKNFLSL